ncbi:MAG: choice-of-anchor D domain-containing protein, partial [Candidatus Latescibacteria bacterium]|nr:choice-of-anchor D domain-containing protein [Candidatus Latescibacterota bacterium]
GVVPPGTSMVVAVTFDAEGLYGGDYNANLLIENNDPLNPEVLASSHLHVTGAPDIQVTPLALDYGPVFIGAVSNQALEIRNTGTDVLTVSSIVTTHGDYTTSAANAVVAPGTSQVITVSYAPTATGINNATLTLTSDDPDEAIIDVALAGEGLEPPVISVTPLSMSEDLFTGGSATQTLTIDNSAGGSSLIWSAAPAFPDNTSSVVEASVVFGAGEIVDVVKDPKRSASAPRPDRSAVVEFGPRATTPRETNAEPVIAAAQTSLEDILANLDENFASVNSLVPNRFDFTEGETGNMFIDGGNDMYDGGNMLGTNLGGPVMYSNGVVAPSTIFGPLGRYFTRKYPGLFVMVADMSGIEYFEIFGNLGADGGGNVDGAILAGDVSGIPFQGFVKRVYNAFDPSVNQLILVEENPSAGHEFATNTDDKYHRAFGLSQSVRVYYALYASANGGYIDNAATLAIMEAFLNALGLAPGWVSIEPDQGTVPAGSSADIQVTFDATGLNGGDYDANILVANNDPLNPEVVVTTHMHVTGAPDIVVAPTALDFGQLFIGATADRLVDIMNEGTDVLTISSIAANHPDYSVSAANAVLPPGASVTVTVTYAPTTAAVHNAVLTVASDDPDEGSLPVTLTGEGLVPPVIAVTPTSISDDLFSGAVVQHTLNIDNSAGGSNLFWTATAADAGDTSSVVEASPVFGSGAVASLKKPARPMISAAQPSPSETFAFTSRAAAAEPAAAAVSLETVLASLNSQFGSVTSLIPDRFDFTEGETGNNIMDGGNDMYDGGNFLATNILAGLSYSDNAIVASAAFGPDGRYFTRKYPGLFVMVADMSSVDYFHIYGNLGADGSGNVDGAVLSAEVSGVPFQGFVKRVYNAFDPSVNHLILVEENPAASHSFSTFTDDDYHVAFGLSSSRRIYYLLYASNTGGYIDNEATLAIMEAFLGSIGMAPEWISLTPTSGTVPAGTNANVQVTLDATALVGGDYNANIQVVSNDPVTPEVVVPVHMRVTGAPDIAVSPTFIPFGLVFVGATAHAPLMVANNGTDVLNVSNIAVSPQFATDLTTFAVAPGASQIVTVSFSPNALGLQFGTLTISSDDPDEGTFAMYVFGEGVEPPIVALSTASLSDDLVEGEVDTQVLTVSNVGANTLDFSVSIEPGEALV